MSSREECWFCHVPKASGDASFCTNCGRELEAKGNFIDLSTTTANYDPMHPARKPWKEPVPVRKQAKSSKPAFYNSVPWGKNVPPARAARPKGSEDSKLLHSEQFGYQDSAVYMDGVQYKGAAVSDSYLIIFRSRIHINEPRYVARILLEEDNSS